MVLNILTNFCDWWWLAWLLPFLLGLLLGWLLWARYKGMVAELESEVSRLKARIKDLEGKLEQCKARRSELESDLSRMRGQIRELEAAAKASAKAPVVKAAAATSSFVATPAPEPTPAPAAPAAKSGVSADKFAALKSDNLQVVEGIGPKMESVLKDNGTHTWSDLASKSSADVKGILGKYGDKYRIIDPTTWPAQAKLARDGNWDSLIDMQKNLDTGRSDKATGLTDSKVEKIMIKKGILKRWKENDLKAVEGIGPKIAGLLNADGINTWRALSETSVERIQGILNAAGKRYQLADPTTWPKQAGMAADGKWDELTAYQDELNGGR